MEETINSLNVEVGVFLANLRSYAANKQFQIGTKTVELLSDTVSCIVDFVAKATVTEIPNEANVDFLRDVNDQHYELRRNIMCRLCIEPISITKDDFEAHLRKNSHLSRLQRVCSSPLRPCSPDIQVKNEPRKQNHSPTEELAKVLVTDESNHKIDAKREDGVQQQSVSNTYMLENVTASKFQGNRILDSDSSPESSAHGFNYDSKYLIEVRGLPWSTTRQDIINFFKDVTILNGPNGIHFMTDATDRKIGRAFIQLAQLKDFKLVRQYNLKYLGDRCIQVLISPDAKSFNDLLAMRQIPSKEHVVFIEGLPPILTEQDIRQFFDGLSIESIRLIESKSKTGTTEAYVKFCKMDDVEIAIKRYEKKPNIRIYRSTMHQMQYDYKLHDFKSSSRSSNHNNARSLQADESTDDYRGGKFLKVRGVPWTADKPYIIQLFPGLTINRENGIEFEHDEKGRKNGTAFVALCEPAEYQMALHTDLTSVNKYLKVTKATKDDFILTKEANAHLP